MIIVILDTNCSDYTKIQSQKIQIDKITGSLLKVLAQSCLEKSEEGLWALNNNCTYCPFYNCNHKESENGCIISDNGYGIPSQWIIYKDNEEIWWCDDRII